MTRYQEVNHVFNNTEIGNGIRFYDHSNSETQGNGTNNTLTISIEEAIERVGYGPFQHRVLLAAGCCFAADSMEILLLSFLSVVLQVEWNLTSNHTKAITSSVFLGAMIGTLVLGPAGDRIGRKPVFILTAAMIAIFGFGTAAVTSFGMLLVIRFMVGFGVGGLTVPFDVLAEFMPLSHRGSNLLLIEYFWTLGTLCVPGIAYLTLGHHSEDATTSAMSGDDNVNNSPSSWRLFVVLCSLPCVLSTALAMYCVPESPRWLLSMKRDEEALSVLRLAAQINGQNPVSAFPIGTKISDDNCLEGEKGCTELLSPKWRRITINLWCTWAGFAVLYYGTIMIITQVFAAIPNNDNNEAKQSERYSFDYQAIFLSATAEIAGTTIMVVVVDRIGRIPMQAVSYLLGGVCVFLFCIIASGDIDTNRTSLIATSFLARMFFMSASCASWVSTAEILTTEIRTTGHSAANAVARLSGAFSPFILNLNGSTSYTNTGFIILLISIGTCFVTWNLPETKGQSMGAVQSNNLQTGLHMSVDDDEEDIDQIEAKEMTATTNGLLRPLS